MNKEVREAFMMKKQEFWQKIRFPLNQQTRIFNIKIKRFYRFLK